jgi:hypothetical protein
MAWGGAEEQAAEFREGNYDAKNWQDEAQKILEDTVSLTQTYVYTFLPCSFYDARWNDTGMPAQPPLTQCQPNPVTTSRNLMSRSYPNLIVIAYPYSLLTKMMKKGGNQRCVDI